MFLRGVGVGAQQYAWRNVCQRMFDVLWRDWRGADAMDHAAGADIGVQSYLVDGLALRIVVAGGIAVGAGVGGERDAADVHRAAFADFPGGLGAVGGVARPYGSLGGEGGADVPDGL